METLDNCGAIGAYLREQREARKISLREMARRLHLSPTYINKIEQRGEKPGEEVVKGYARELDLDADALLLKAGRLPSDLLPILQANPSLLKILRGVN